MRVEGVRSHMTQRDLGNKAMMAEEENIGTLVHRH